MTTWVCIAYKNTISFIYELLTLESYNIVCKCLDISAAVHRSLRTQFLHHRQVSQKRQRRLPLDWRGRSYSLSNQVCWWSKDIRVLLIQTRHFWTEKAQRIDEIYVLGWKTYSNCHKNLDIKLHYKCRSMNNCQSFPTLDWAGLQLK